MIGRAFIYGWLVGLSLGFLGYPYRLFSTVNKIQSNLPKVIKCPGPGPLLAKNFFWDQYLGALLGPFKFGVHLALLTPTHNIKSEVANPTRINFESKSKTQIFGIFWNSVQYNLGRAKVKEFQTLSKKLMIYGLKDPPPKFQPSIRSKGLRENIA